MNYTKMLDKLWIAVYAASIVKDPGQESLAETRAEEATKALHIRWSKRGPTQHWKNRDE